jgi:peptidoglycan/xylan/chitin deacetylase (PgdA/CDA1 family)
MVSQAVKRRLEALLARVPQHDRNHRRRLVVLSYHSVNPDSRFTSATPTLFDQHLRWLKEHCELVSFGKMAELRSSSGKGRPIVAITFDDGYSDNHSYALPALVAHSVPATFFVTTGLAGGERAVIERFARLWAVPADEIKGLTWSQVRELQAVGMEFGAHTRTHPNLAAADEAKTWAEIMDSKSLLEDELQEGVKYFAYPFGNPRQHFSPTTMKLAAEAGFELAAAVQFRAIRPEDHPLNIPRYPVTGDSIEVLRAKIFGRLDVLGFLREHAPLWMMNLTSTESSYRLRD